MLVIVCFSHEIAPVKMYYYYFSNNNRTLTTLKLDSHLKRSIKLSQKVSVENDEENDVQFSEKELQRVCFVHMAVN